MVNGTRLGLGVLLVALLGVPAFLPPFYVYLLALILVTGLLAASLNLVLGFGGLYQFHHAVFYGIGAYTLAIAITKLHWPAWVGLVAGPVAAALAGLLMGLVCVRLERLYFGMLQLSLGSFVWIVALRWYPVTGGDNGLHGIPLPAVLKPLGNAYLFILAAVAASLFVLWAVVRSPFGLTLQAIRDNPQRCQVVGIHVRAHQLAAMVLAAFFAGVAGVLYVVLERSVFPNMLFWVLSLEILVMCLLGGWFTFPGPLLGAALVVALRTFAGRYTEYWTLILGVLLILLIFFLPEGILGTLGAQRAQKTPEPTPRPAPAGDVHG
ncbi:MAG: branched-chain amino acid ABC transporter permease [Armatimonadetes bacterium]|nr:branched-chain amino acid ABC transporter permease [Armatimonadota bacterium]MDW8153667.1 branched-chain amino acid ABC transporter permease [Armatimonadota bacterium]